MNITAHIINHTHWDREWFLTSIYTNQWIPGLIDKLEQLVADNPDYKFLLDGQTLVIEDLLKIAPGYKAKIERLVKGGHLIIGPYYCQPDWQITGGESLIRNLLYGWQDMQQYGAGSRTGWLVDTFGHISQAPQLHRLFGLEAVFVWRGVPRLEPYFHWQGANGQRLLTINLFGGYRNLYGVTRTAGIAIKRLSAEVAKLRPFYPTSDIPLFDGYDLEQEPEDPIRFYQQHLSAIPRGIQIKGSAPEDFAREISAKLQRLPTIAGELNSGKYGATFPGALSTRTYLKVMNRDCEYWLYRLCEPLAALARLKGKAYNAQQYQTWGRTLLQNTVHDCICGVSVDQVHEKMEFSYRELFQATRQDIHDSLAYVLRDFAPGVYAVSTNPFAYEGWRIAQGKLCHVQTNGIGVWQVGPQLPLETPNTPVEEFAWQNDHYRAVVRPEGTVQIGEAVLGYFTISEERGDAYSDEAGRGRGACRANGPLTVEQKSAHYCVVRYDCAWQGERAQVSATVRLIFDRTPLLRWQVDLDSRGTDFRVELVFETAQSGEIYAGMPFDVARRPPLDKDLLPRQLEKGLAKVLLGQRELEAVKTFPFHDFVAISDGTSSAVVFAKGLHAYQAEEDGTISLTLRRAVEWLTKPDLRLRAGDAGPFMYIPDARCERTVKHEIAVMIGETTMDDLTIHHLNAGFQNPPLIVASQGNGTQTRWQFLPANLPLSSLSLYNDKLLARFFNPTGAAHSFEQAYRKTDVWGNPEATIQAIPAKDIVTIQIEQALPPLSDSPGGQIVTAVEWPAWRVGENKGLPEAGIIEQLQAKIAQLEAQLAQVEAELNNAGEDERHILQHRYYVLKRKLYELRLSTLLNQRKLARQSRLDREYLYTPDPEIAGLGRQLNQLRIKRRIYDYIVAAL
ncbi:MAG: hypothetical protein ACE5H9_03825 [Anaerolineae bacterium]